MQSYTAFIFTRFALKVRSYSTSQYHSFRGLTQVKLGVKGAATAWCYGINSILRHLFHPGIYHWKKAYLPYSVLCFPRRFHALVDDWKQFQDSVECCFAHTAAVRSFVPCWYLMSLWNSSSTIILICTEVYWKELGVEQQRLQSGQFPRLVASPFPVSLNCLKAEMPQKYFKGDMLTFFEGCLTCIWVFVLLSSYHNVRIDKKKGSVG